MSIPDEDFLGGMFDLNSDGHIDLGEEFMAYKMFEEVTKDFDPEESFEEEEEDD